jgi:hypothetical protein
MAWRTVSHHGRTWDVRPVAERRSGIADWQLVFGFRPTGDSAPGGTRWALTEFTGRDKPSLFKRADRVTDDDLVALLESVLPRDGG